jgi:hypothetical protein
MKHALSLVALVLLAFGVACASTDNAPPTAPLPTSAASGPTITLHSDNEQVGENAAADFMYFVRLISPAPVSVSHSPGNTQKVKVLSIVRNVHERKLLPLPRNVDERDFTATAEVEFSGTGSFRYLFDQTGYIEDYRPAIHAGIPLTCLLEDISVNNGGFAKIDVSGTVNQQEFTIAKFTISFHHRGQKSPVTISLYDIEERDGKFARCNEIVAAVDTLTFWNTAEQPKMGVTVASIKDKGAADGAWQNFIAVAKGTVANIIIEPIRIEPIGNQTVIAFGLAIASQSPTFTFPNADVADADASPDLPPQVASAIP